jgi:hypothetical protein
VSDEEIERIARKSGLLECIDDAYLARGDWLPEAREFASLLQSAERERCAQEAKKLRAFAREVMEAWPEGGIEGDDLQEIAHRHGMLAPEIRHEPCGEWCNCNAGVDVDGGEWDRGVECYRRTALLTGESE